MCGSMADIQSLTAEIRRGNKKRRRRNSMKIYTVCPIHRATIKQQLKIMILISKSKTTIDMSQCNKLQLTGKFTKHTKSALATG